MGARKTAIYLHFVWATVERLPLIVPEIQRRLYRCIQAEVRRSGAIVLALGGVEDHVHLLAALPTTLNPEDLMQQVKGVSSQVARQLRGEEEYFRWQHGYGVFSVSPSHRSRIIAYIQNQKEHHASGEVWPSCEPLPDDDEFPPPAAGLSFRHSAEERRL